MSTTESINGNKSPQHHPPEGTWDTIEASSRTVFPDTGFVYHSAEWPYNAVNILIKQDPGKRKITCLHIIHLFKTDILYPWCMAAMSQAFLYQCCV